MRLSLKLDNKQTQAIEEAINIAIDSGALGYETEIELAEIREQLERLISLQNLANRNMGRA